MMANNIDLWWSKFKTMADEVVGDRAHYYKEKYGWFRVELYEWFNDCITDKLIEIENKSYQCCQRCAKFRTQYWTDTWWIEHFCLPCYIIVWIKSHWRRFKYKIKEIWKRT